ncbi:MAG TPA: hypothetical protein VK986_23120, partial [Tepidisphaeraceae bacterium]|nr:hypothetical protein [Tepidisphaeraceae bacterium]
REVRGRAGKVGVATGLAVGAGVAGYAILWASYGFKFHPSADGRDGWDFAPLMERLAYKDTFRRNPGHEPDPAELARYRPNAMIRAALWFEQARVLPQTWVYGFVSTYADSLLRRGYLLGKVEIAGRWSYYPCVFAFKTPVGSQLALYGAAVMAGALGWRRAGGAGGAGGDGGAGGAAHGRGSGWAAACLLLPAGLYTALAMTSSMNLGVRHLLPVYPLLFVAAGWAWSGAVRRWARPAWLVIGAVIAAVALESLVAAPNFLSFFNTPSGGERGGTRLLSDSNLDWGQDLPALAAWQRANSHRRLYLRYFGTARPGYYGIRYALMPGTGPALGQHLDATGAAAMPDEPGVLAISATELQGVYLTPDEAERVRPLLDRPPTMVLNGTIYLYDLAQ